MPHTIPGPAHRKPLLPLLVLLAAFPPLCTDMYLPALPTLQRTWNQPLILINLTLIVFFVAYCSFLLVYGPISDRYGRRRPLMAGILLYILGSVACAWSSNVFWMIGARVLQAMGGAAASAISLAITKDVYDGHRRARVIAHIGVIIALAPMLAPVLGSWILTWTSWRWIFHVQAAVGVVALAGVWRMPETLPPGAAVSMRTVLGNYLLLLRNGRFMGLTLAMSSMSLPGFAFIAGSSDIYINRFGLSPASFGHFFAFNALGMMLGPFAFTRMCLSVPSTRLMTLGFVGVLISGLWLVLDPGAGPWHFALPNWMMTFFMGLSRPPSNNLALEQADRGAGAAASLLMFTVMIVGAVGMWIISLNWADKVRLIGVLATLAGGGSVLFWAMCKDRFEVVDAG